jgi:hypothetical protein
MFGPWVCKEAVYAELMYQRHRELRFLRTLSTRHIGVRSPVECVLSSFTSKYATCHFKGTRRFVVLNVPSTFCHFYNVWQNGDFVCTFQIFCETFRVPFNCSAEGNICLAVPVRPSSHSVVHGTSLAAVFVSCCCCCLFVFFPPLQRPGPQGNVSLKNHNSRSTILMSWEAKRTSLLQYVLHS